MLYSRNWSLTLFSNIHLLQRPKHCELSYISMQDHVPIPLEHPLFLYFIFLKSCLLGFLTITIQDSTQTVFWLGSIAKLFSCIGQIVPMCHTVTLHSFPYTHPHVIVFFSFASYSCEHFISFLYLFRNMSGF